MLERYLLLMADVPGLQVYPALKPLDARAKTYGLEITLKYRKVDGFANLDNRGTTAVGPLQAYVCVNLNSTLGLLERTTVGIFTVPYAWRELRYVQIAHEQSLDPEGTKAWITASRSLVDTETTGAGTKEQSSSTRFTIGLSHPFIRYRKLSVTGSATLDGSNSEKNAPGDDFEDRLRVLRLGGQVSYNDDWNGANFAAVEVSKGFDILGASEPDSQSVSRPGGRSDFFKVRVDAARRQKVAKDVHVLLTAGAQKSSQTLLSSEEFSLGGKRFGRANDPSLFSGSDRIAGAVELQLTTKHKSSLIQDMQVYIF